MPVMAMGVAELKRELKAEGGLSELPEIHQFLDGFYMSRIGIRILIGQHIALHEPQQKDHIGEYPSLKAHLYSGHSMTVCAGLYLDSNVQVACC